MSDEEAEWLLQHYLSHFDSWIPFVEIMPTTTAAELQREKPMLWLSIMFAASYHDHELQKVMAHSTVAYLGEQIFQHGQRSLQLLQGLLVFIFW